MKYLVIISTLFVIGSVFGYGLEVLFRRFVSQKKWMNPGFLVGPYIPLYGFGVILLYGLSNIPLPSNAIPEFWMVIIKIIVIGVSLTVIELIAGIIFIKGMHIKLWDYSNRWGNFKGIICPLFSALWFVAGSLYFFFINPYLVSAIEWISENLIYTYFIGLIIGMMVVDAAYSLHLGLKLREASEGLTIKYEQFKQDVKKDSKEISSKGKFYGTMIAMYRANQTLKDKIEQHVNSLPKPKKWWKKD